MLILSILIAAAWTYLFALHGGFWRTRDKFFPGTQTSSQARVAVVIPARDEADGVGATITSLLSQEYAGEIRIFLVDDHSSDGTAALAKAAAARLRGGNALTIIQGASLPAGWSGKVWAMHQGWQIAREWNPDFFLLTDADIVHEPKGLRALVAKAEGDDRDLVSLMVRLHCESAAERILIPAFIYFFFMLYPPRWIASRGRTAGAAGGCVLLRPAALKRAGGLEAIKGEIIDDCSLAKRVKNSGGRLWLGLASETRSLRVYSGFGEVRDMIARTAFNQLHHSVLSLVGCVVGMAFAFLLPFALLFITHGRASAFSIVACVLLLASYTPILHYYRVPTWRAITLPVAAMFYLYATLLSAFRYWRGTGGQWKGRAQDLTR